jgi:hypothetical protein
MSELDFLVGETVEEIRYSAPGNLRVVFDGGDRVEPDLYADLGPFEPTARAGDIHSVDAQDPNTVGPVMRLVGCRVENVDTEGCVLTLSFSDGSHLRG